LIHISDVAFVEICTAHSQHIIMHVYPTGMATVVQVNTVGQWIFLLFRATGVV
jgi:hypothetical protein